MLIEYEHEVVIQNQLTRNKDVSLEDPDMRLFATEDPRGFLATYPDKTIIDEVQRVPSIFSYIQTHTDKENKEGMYLLAGRTAILRLLPFSHLEMKEGNILPSTVNEEIFKGAYPRLYDKDITPTDYYPFYIQTYIERDVRLMRNIGDLSKIHSFFEIVCRTHWTAPQYFVVGQWMWSIRNHGNLMDFYFGGKLHLLSIKT